MCLMFELWGQIDWKSCFWKLYVEFKCFWKTFHLILMHFILNTMCFEEFLHKNAMFFKKLIFPNFWLIKHVALMIKKCNKNFGYNLPGSIDVWLVLDRSKLLFDRSNLFFDQSKIGQKVFLRSFSHVFITLFILFQKLSLSSSSIDPFQVNFCHFLPEISQVFLSSSAVKT